VDSPGLDAPVSKHVAPVAAHGDQPACAQQGLLVTPPAVVPTVGDAWQLVDERHEGSGGAPEIQVRINDDASERVNDDHVVFRRVERGAKPWGGGSLLLLGCSAGHDFLYIETPLPQAGDQARIVQVASGLAARIPHREERDAQENSFQSSPSSRAA
jgi:hypothetical protein